MSRLTHDRVCAFAAIVAFTLAAACSDATPTATRTPTVVSSEAPALGVSAEAAGPTKSVVPTGEGLGVYPGLGAPSPTRTRYRTEYHNGPVMIGSTNVYLIWYGTWTQPNPSEPIIVRMLGSLGGSAYFRINTLYAETNGATPTGGIAYTGAAFDATYSHGAVLSKSDVADVVRTKILSSELPLDQRGVYVVLASPEVTVDGFGERFCAYHGATDVAGATVRVVFVGSPARVPTRCQPQSVGPNGDAAVDAAASLLAAELANTIVDPTFQSWYDRLGLEPADKCAWTYGTTYRTANGALANINLGGADYLLQQLWVPTKNGGTCALKIPGT